MFDAKDEKEFYIEVKFIKYGTYTFHATSKEHAMEMYDRGEWSDYDEEYDCYNEEILDHSYRPQKRLANVLNHNHDISTYRQGLSQPCLLYTSPSPRDKRQSRMPSSA